VRISLLIAGLLFAPGVLVAEDAPPAAETATEVSRASALIKEWEAQKELTTASASKLVDSLVALGPRATKAITSALEASKESITAGVLLTALVRLKAKDASPTLLKLALAETDSNSRKNLFMALEQIGSPESAGVLVDSVKGALPVELKDPNNKDGRDAYNEHQQLVFRTIVAMCQNFDAAAEVISSIQKRIPLATPDVKMQYVRILESIPNGWSEDVLFALAFDLSTDVKTAAILALGKAGTASKANQIHRQLSQDSPNVKVAVCCTLGKLKYLPAVPDLINLLSDKNRDIVQAALWALKNISGVQFEASVERWKTWYDTEMSISSERLKTLLDQARLGPKELIPIVIEEMGQLHLLRNKLVGELREFLNSLDPKVKAAACNVLAQTGDERAPLLLLPLLSDASDIVKYSAWRGLRYCTGKDLPLDLESWSKVVHRR
jgi:HEAT repeat protein